MKLEPRRLVASVAACTVVLVGATWVVDRTVATTPDPVAAAPAPPGAATLAIASFVYNPNPVSVAPGTVIAVTNQDNAKHTVTAGTRDEPSDAFDLKLDAAASGTFVAPSEPGSYPYICTIHPGMKATLEVTP